MKWYRNSGRGDRPGVVNLNKARPKYHAAREDWIATGRAMCGASIARPGFESDRTVYTPDAERCARCFATLRRIERELAKARLSESLRFVGACMNRGLHLR